MEKEEFPRVLTKIQKVIFVGYPCNCEIAKRQFEARGKQILAIELHKANDIIGSEEADLFIHDVASIYGPIKKPLFDRVLCVHKYYGPQWENVLKTNTAKEIWAPIEVDEFWTWAYFKNSLTGPVRGIPRVIKSAYQVFEDKGVVVKQYDYSHILSQYE